MNTRSGLKRFFPQWLRGIFPGALFTASLSHAAFMCLLFPVDSVNAGVDLRNLVFEGQSLNTLSDYTESAAVVTGAEERGSEEAVRISNFLAQALYSQDFLHTQNQAPPDTQKYRAQLPGLRGRDTKNVTYHDSALPLLNREHTELDLDYPQLIREQLQAIDKLIVSEGPFTKNLKQELLRLGALYQDSGQYQFALDTFQRALQNSKVHSGLFHEEQISIIESVVQNLIALADYNEVNEQLEFLVYLYQKCYGSNSPEFVQALADKVAWDIYIYEYTAQNGGASIFSGNSIATNNNAFTGDFNSLAKPQENIIKGIQILVKENDFENPFLFMFEQQLIATYFYQAFQNGLAGNVNGLHTQVNGALVSINPYDQKMANYQNGEKSYQRLLKYMEYSQQHDSFNYILATIGLGDWYLLFGKYKKSHEYYQQANALLSAGEFTDDEKKYLLHPDVPHRLPDFNLSPFVTRESLEKFNTVESSESYKGYIDVSFEVSRFGRVKNFSALGNSEDTSDDVITALELQIRNSQFRPALNIATEKVSPPTLVRYYYNY